MVHLGIRDETSQLSLNIMGPDEICDGSQGLLKFISQAYQDGTGQMIASLEPHLCATAGTFCHLNQRQLISWTCSKDPGIMSLKPTNSDVIIAVHKMIQYFQWKTVGFAKSRHDRSPFCEDLGAHLAQDQIKSNNNFSVMILGNFEDLDQNQFAMITKDLDGLFICISYGYGLTHNLSDKTELRARSTGGSGRGPRGSHSYNRRYPFPLVLLPEWPLPIEIFSLEHPTLALISNPHPFPSSSSSFDFEPKISEFVEFREGKSAPHKLMETLLAQMILKSVKIGLELERSQSDPPTTTTTITSTTNPRSHHDNNPNHHQQQQQQHQQETHHAMPFLFTIVQYDDGRWHPIINLGNGDKVNSPRVSQKEEGNDIEEDYIFTWIQIFIAVVVTTVIISSIVAVTFYARGRVQASLYSGSTSRRKFSRRHRSQGPYKIILTSNDVIFGPGLATNETTTSNKKHSRSPFGHNGGHRGPEEMKPDLLKGSIGTLRKNPSSANIKAEPIILSENQGRYKGDVVHMKRLAIPPETFEVRIKAMTVLESLHGLRHENLAAMLGCLTEPRPAIVWEFCSRGSLHDIIKQCDIKLDWAFKLSLLTDLVRGMRYLHSSLVRVHGFLSSFNCVIDARWVLKITDYGLPALYHTQGLSAPSKSAKDLLWTAPELLRDEIARNQGTHAGDVYSFAIIMQEVLVRGEPYCMLTLTPEEILEKVKRPPPLIRPSVSKGAAPPEAINIMRQCWAELPDMRPDFMVIHDLFKTLNHGRKANIVDTMFQMLEKYSNNLEELIRERTEQLDLEKKKTEQLLNRMLPSTVAEKLKLGLPVDPEEFSEVTIYFSDIVGFTTISAYSTPFEVVDLLNDLYTCFDATINDYNVYKVETIGDAYMVVGGAPVWSHDHSDQIATMALDLLHQSGKFWIRHLPYTPLRLRIGLHTGPCCAGVVGLTMPRYCLFGDTVNTASRMESTGSAWRIHISGETKAKLDQHGGYIIQYRGMTNIKGKGQMPTYWLLGKEGFDKELPTPPGLEESHGLDEKAILFGRTGKMPGDEPEPKVKKPLTTPSNSLDLNVSGARLEPKPTPSYALLTGESLRSLSPAEQVAHQLLNGRPTAKGLRRQFSLDQGGNSHAPLSRSAFRKAPSLEEGTEIISSPAEKLSGLLTGSNSEANVKSCLSTTFDFPSADNNSDAINKLKASPRPLKPLTITKGALSIVEESPVMTRKQETIKTSVSNL
ncbi:unnamed protein product [Allacma fusca]|uniref:Guanylate cyclase n=1 Tax=Allacma fusca TaxID=39272 RepID=A0A8J2P913_9HEXA|nr:unnamed protein product [Allacma fusca]